MSLKIISGNKIKWVQFKMWARIARIDLIQTKNPIKTIKGFLEIRRHKNNLVSKQSLKKLVWFNNRYFWDLNQPGWPSKAFDQNFKWMSQQIHNKEKKHIESVRLVFLAITKQCPMKCEHCYEADALNQPEILTLDVLKKIVAKYQKLGAASFIIGGGEPLTRFKDLIELLKSAQPTSDFWISTSGYGLTEKKAKQLKEAGLTGISISVDNYDEAANNAFRGHPQAMNFVKEAAKNTLAAGLGLSTAICATKDFITKENMYKYAAFSKGLGSGFIWLIEPRAAGNYKNKDVQLHDHHFEILDEFYYTLNHHKKYLDYPRVIFPNYNHRKIGCAGAGTRNIMIDTNGNINPCPFCRHKGLYALADDSETKVREMISGGCHKFETRVS